MTLITQEINFFSRPQEIFTSTHRETVEILPILNNEDIVSFSIPKSTKSFTSSGFLLRTKWHLMNGNKKLAPDDTVACLCGIQHAMVSRVLFVLCLFMFVFF